MRYRALATDYDGTLAHDGVVAPSTLAALKRVRDSGRKLILVTGRELDELLAIFPRHDRFDRVVAENGALFYRPDTGHVHLLAESPPDRFVADLQRRGVEPLSIGRTIVATVEPHHQEVLASIHALGLEWHVVFNKGSVMVLPSGVTKATGLIPALADLGIPLEQVVGVGDAENDHAFLTQCGCAVAVANALRAVKERCDLVTAGCDGAGVEELIDRLLHDDLAGLGHSNLAAT
jgi:HAD superfamily hydrolase (TIGR01484 family)